MDDVSLRGARGLLISITGGKDLTLYDVDEAATRILRAVKCANRSTCVAGIGTDGSIRVSSPTAHADPCTEAIMLARTANEFGGSNTIRP